MLVEVGGLALSVVTLLLQRLDRRRDEVRHSPDLQAALLVLSESLGRWAQAASITNQRLMEKRFRGFWLLRPLQRRVWRPLQRPYAEKVTAWLDEEGAGNVASAQAILAAYAPELREQLREVAATRAAQLDEIERATRRGSKRFHGEGDADFKRSLNLSLRDLIGAKKELDEFIRQTFPQPPTASS